MTLYIDTSALLRRYLADPERPLVVDAMEADSVWCGSAISRTEGLMALHQIAYSQSHHEELWQQFRLDWDSVVEIPVDDRCLSRAAEIGAQFRLRAVDAIHLAAADRLPRPLSYLTLERQQLAAAVELGFAVITPLAE